MLSEELKAHWRQTGGKGVTQRAEFLRERIPTGHSLRVILEVLRLCQLIIFCCSIFASQNKLLGRNCHLKQSMERKKPFSTAGVSSSEVCFTAI